MPEQDRRDLAVVGQPLPKVDAAAKVTGQTVFADDVVLPRMLFAKLLRSPHPHARIRKVDVSKAAAHPGVVATLVGTELPIPFGILPVSQDEHALCVDKVRFVGDPVAAVAALDEETAAEAPEAHRGRLRGAARPHVDRRGARPARRADPRVRPPRQRPQGGLLRLRGRRGGLPRGRSRPRGHVLLRGEHPPADGAARQRGLLRPRRQAHAVVLHPDAALRAPRAGRGARDGARAHPRHRLPERRRLRREERPLRPRDRGGEALDEDGPAGEDHPHARGGLLLPPRPPPREDVGEDRAEEGRRHHGHALPHRPRRRRLRELRGGQPLLHGRPADRHLPHRALQVRGRARLHQQAALRPQARARHAPAALRPRVPHRPLLRRPRDRPRGMAAPEHRRAGHHHRQPDEGAHHRARASASSA